MPTPMENEQPMNTPKVIGEFEILQSIEEYISVEKGMLPINIFLSSHKLKIPLLKRDSCVGKQTVNLRRTNKILQSKGKKLVAMGLPLVCLKMHLGQAFLNCSRNGWSFGANICLMLYLKYYLKRNLNEVHS